MRGIDSEVVLEACDGIILFCFICVFVIVGLFGDWGYKVQEEREKNCKSCNEEKGKVNRIDHGHGSEGDRASVLYSVAMQHADY